MPLNILRYSDSRDNAYGLAGMTITLVALDGESYFDAIDLDAAVGDQMAMSHDFGLRGNPRMSAKIIWEQTMRELRLSAMLALGNVTCRRYLLDHRTLNADELHAVRYALRHDAGEHLELDNDEADNLFDSCRQYTDRLFRHPGVVEISHNFAGRIAKQRRMSAAEAIEILASLGLK